MTTTSPQLRSLILRHSRTPEWLWYALLAALVAVFLGDALLPGRMLLMRDAVCNFLPFRMFSAQALREGHFPLWNPYSNCGQPYAANPQTAVFYLPHLLFVVLSPITAMKVSLFLHLLLAASGFFALMRHWRFYVGPSLLAAVAFTFSTLTIAVIEFQSLFNTLVWYPAILLFVSVVFRTWENLNGGRFRHSFVHSLLPSLALGWAVALSVLAGYPQTLLFSLVAVMFYAVPCLWRRPWHELLGVAASLAVAAIVTLLLCAPQMILTRELLPLSIRALEQSSMQEDASFGGQAYVSLLAPFWFGQPGYTTWRAPHLMEFWLGTCYMGLMPFGLAVITLPGMFTRGTTWKPSERLLIRCFWACVALGFLWAAGKYLPFSDRLFSSVPPFNRFRWPSKALQLVLCAVPILAACGAQALARLVRRPWLWGVVVALAFLNLFFISRQIHPIRSDRVYRMIPPKRNLGPEPMRIQSDILGLQQALYGIGDEEVYATAVNSLIGDVALPAHQFKVFGGGELRLSTFDYAWANLRRGTPEFQKKLLDLWNVGAEAEPATIAEIVLKRKREVHLLERPSACPRAYLVKSCEPVSGLKDAFRAMERADFSCTGSVTIPGGGLELMEFAENRPESVGRVTDIRYDWNRTSMVAETSTSAMLVFAEADYPGWKATVGGARTEILPANGLFRAVQVPAGRSEVVFTYEANGFRWGMVAAGVGLLGSIATAIWSLRVRRPPNGLA